MVFVQGLSVKRVENDGNATFWSYRVPRSIGRGKSEKGTRKTKVADCLVIDGSGVPLRGSLVLLGVLAGGALVDGAGGKSQYLLQLRFRGNERTYETRFCVQSRSRCTSFAAFMPSAKFL